MITHCARQRLQGLSVYQWIHRDVTTQNGRHKEKSTPRIYPLGNAKQVLLPPVSFERQDTCVQMKVTGLQIAQIDLPG